MTTSMTITIDPEIKQQAQELFAGMGMDTATAIDIFLRHAIMANGMPFDVKSELPNSETLDAMTEVDEIRKNPSIRRSYKDATAMFRDILS